MDAFEGFLDDVMARNIDLYPHQEEAVLEVMSGNNVILATPTGSGKSLVAEAQHYLALQQGGRSYYTSPIKALVSEKFFALCERFGADNVGMLTGDAAINRDAPIVCCTAEILANLALRDGPNAEVDFVCMDEFHYYADPDRGMAWQIPLLILEHAQFLLMSATLGDTTHIEESLHELTGRDTVVVSTADRPVPLSFEYSEEGVTWAIDGLVKKDRAPIYVVNASQREAAEQAQAQMSVNVCSKEEKKAIAAAIRGFRWSSPYGKDVQRYVRHGIGLHHAGLLPKYRLLVEKLAQQGLLKIINGTDTLGVGVNVPIRTVLFTKLCKFDGQRVRILKVREFKQIAGRAGRKGYDNEGWVVVQAPEHTIDNRRLEARAAQQGKKKFKRKKPPERGYVPWNKKTFDKLITGQSEALDSVFRIDQGMMLNLLQREGGQGYGALVDLVHASHTHKGRKSRLKREARDLFKALCRAGIVEVWREPGRRPEVLVQGDLQWNFSLHHTLSLYLVEAIEQLDMDDPDYPFRLLTLVESILENPRGILMRQVSRAKGELVAALKAEGIPYEERMERLEEVTWPRPDKEWIWQSLDAFIKDHPWVENEAIKVKSIAREMVERWLTFDEYVKDLGLQRMEGVLLRYLTQTYKTLLQNVPDDRKTDEVIDVEAFLRTMLARVDSSLVKEWETLHQEPEEALELGAPIRARRLDDDMRSFRARIRAELHHLIAALGHRDYEVAVVGIRGEWTAEQLEEAMSPFYEEYDRLICDKTARLTDKTRMTGGERRRWELTQTLVDPDGDNLWAIHAIVDLEALGDDTDRPLLELIRIGT